MAMKIQELVARAKQEVRNLSVDEMSQQVESGEVTIVDIREPDEVAREGAIPGAVLAPRGMLEFWADPTSPYHRPELDPGRTTILYCASGGRSALATQSLQQLGYTDIAHLDGGLKSWKDHGRPVTFQTQ